MAKEFDVREIMSSLDREVALVSRALAQRVAGTLVLSTIIGRPDLWQSPPPPGYRPGTARGNWRAAIGRTAVENELPIQDAAGATTIGLIENTIRFWDGRKAPLIISNAADHIGPLNDGTASPRQQRGFVGRAVETAIASLNNERIELP